VCSASFRRGHVITVSTSLSQLASHLCLFLLGQVAIDARTERDFLDKESIRWAKAIALL
jgi:hypothetical protein